MAKKHFEAEHLKSTTLLNEVESMKKKLSKLEENIKYYSDVNPTKKEIVRMNRFLKDLKAKNFKAFTSLEELKKK